MILCELSIILILSQFGLSTQLVQIEDLVLSKCSAINYPITINNISVQIQGETIIEFGGSLQTAIDITSPIQAQLKIKRQIFGLWFPIPCEHNLGSCNYPDLCTFGYPNDKKCPNVFVTNNVPCRCPIPKGNYTIGPTISLSKITSVLNGYYKGTINVNQNQQIVSCYNIKFRIYNDYAPEVLQL